MNIILKNAAKAKNYDIDSDNYQIMAYGLKSFLLVAVKSILLFFIAYKIGILREMIYYTVILCIIKLFSLGIHFNPFVCAVMCVVYFFGGIFVAHLVPYSKSLVYIVFAICVVLNIFYAPSPTVNRRIESQKEFMKQKILTLLCIFAVFMQIHFVENPIYKNLSVVAVIVETFTILPITYKISHQERPKVGKKGE